MRKYKEVPESVYRQFTNLPGMEIVPSFSNFGGVHEVFPHPFEDGPLQFIAYTIDGKYYIYEEL